MTTLIEEIKEFGIVPVVKIENARQALSLGKALMDGGLPCAEITFRTAAATEAISILSSEIPDLRIGAGTVLTVEQAESAVSSGARFIVSPGFDPKVVDWCLENDVLVIPGIATPTEINMGLDKGLKVLKFFPAEVLGGTTGLKAISAAYGEVKFIPTGGISASNLASYLSLPMVHACGGSWMVPSDLIKTGDFYKITNLVGQACNIVKQVRSRGMKK
jgi:2-dehydro-3-deoxyphosphogluconate aldolase/(4S)-4-hydroxy-2-oxoglutarate aldolase